MPVAGLAFLFDIVVEELKSFVQTKQFVIKSEFADIFSLVLKSPEPREKKRKRKKSSKKTKSKSKCVKNSTDSADSRKKSQKGQTILFVGNLDILMSHMMQYPMEICLCKESDPDERVASTLIPWSSAFIEYLMSLYLEPSPAAARVCAVHSVFDEATSKRMASVRLTIKLRITDHINLNQYRLLSNKYPNTFLLMDFDTVYVDQSTGTHLSDGPGTIKTIYSSGKQKKRSSINKRNAKREANIAKLSEDRDQSTHALRASMRKTIDKNILLHLTRSEADVASSLKLDLFSSKSCTVVKQINLFDYIFGDPRGPFGKKSYTVGYFTVDNQPSRSVSSPSPQATESPGKTSSKSSTSIDHHLTTSVECKDVTCVYKKERPLLEKPDDRILLDITSIKNACCVTETIEQKLEIKGVGKLEGQAPCFCACECTFGFERKTTFCQVCGGYEKPGEDLDGKPQYLMPDPCPVFHKLSRINTGSTSGSETKKQSRKRTKSPEPDKDNKKEGKYDRFKFNYGYKAPQIGHSRCALPCTGTMSNVPRSMGWLWTADNVPGMVFRPSWKPGAINKVVARKLRMALHPGEVISKRRKATGVKKRPLKRPLLVVHKKSGEFTVTMETMKPYNKPRTLNQQPYEDKDPVTYTIGRTEEENRERKKKRERAARRLEREQREFIQSAFRDMCKDICLKTYQQALGILPDAEDPECACYPPLPDPDRVHEDLSCSCSDDGKSLGSDTDSDEWILEFTPPNARFDLNYPGTKVKQGDKETQYTYLDYRVKLLDRFGNPVPRFFKGVDGKEQCSDLGGFWGPDHQWQMINVDGCIAPDGRWAPFTFHGPSGEQVDTKTGKFQDSSGNWLVIGVDGYVDANNKWKFYKHSPNKSPLGKRKYAAPKPKSPADKKGKPAKKEESIPTFSCFGDATPVDLSRMGIVGHGPDKKLLNRMLKDLIGKGVKVKIPEPSRVPKSPVSKKTRERLKAARTASESERSVCRHPSPSDKGVTRQPDGSVTYFRSKKFVAQGWKPGAVSKYILRKLNRAKLRSKTVQGTAPTKKSKMKCGDKPTIVVNKKDGEYTVEMQVTSNNEHNCIVYDPLIYKIASASNEERVKRREKKAKRLIKNLIKEFDDPFHPDACYETCVKGFEEATGFFHEFPELAESRGDGPSVADSCSCEDDLVSDGSSLDLDWEIQFSPPNARS